MEGFKYHSCPRCQKGDVAVDRDYYGWYEYCVQCGYSKDLDSISAPFERHAVASRRSGKDARIAAGKK